METFINGYVPTDLFIGGQKVDYICKNGQMIYRKKHANFATNYGDDLISTNDTVYSQIKNLKIFGKSSVVDDEIVSTGDSGEIEITSCGKVLFQDSTERIGVREFTSLDITNTVKPLLDKNIPITISFDLKSAIAGNIAIYSLQRVMLGARININATTEYERYTATFSKVYYNPNNGSVDSCALCFYGTYGTGRIPSVKNIQIEIGETGTDYKPYQGSTQSLNLPTPLRGIEISSGGNYTDNDGQTWLSDVLDVNSGTITRYLDDELNILDTPTVEQIDTTALKKLRSYAGQTNLFVSDNAGLKADFRINMGGQTEITGDLLQFDNALTDSYLSVTVDEDCEITRCGRNLFDLNKAVNHMDLAESSIDNVNKTITIYANTGNGYIWNKTFGELFNLKVGEKYILMAVNSSANALSLVYFHPAGETWHYGSVKTITPEILNSNIAFYNNINNPENNVISNIQVTLGELESDYEPYQGSTYTLSAGETIRIPALEGVNTLFSDNGSNLTVKYHTTGESTIETSQALNMLGVNPSNTAEQQIQQLQEMGVEI